MTIQLLQRKWYLITTFILKDTITLHTNINEVHMKILHATLQELTIDLVV